MQQTPTLSTRPRYRRSERQRRHENFKFPATGADRSGRVTMQAPRHQFISKQRSCQMDWTGEPTKIVTD